MLPAFICRILLRLLKLFHVYNLTVWHPIFLYSSLIYLVLHISFGMSHNKYFIVSVAKTHQRYLYFFILKQFGTSFWYASVQRFNLFSFSYLTWNVFSKTLLKLIKYFSFSCTMHVIFFLFIIFSGKEAADGYKNVFKKNGRCCSYKEMKVKCPKERSISGGEVSWYSPPAR